MAATPVDDTDAECEGAAVGGRFVQIDAEAGVIIYDRDNHCAWVQSDAAVSVADRR